MVNTKLNLQELKNEIKPVNSKLRWYVNRPVSIALIVTGATFLLKYGYWYPVKIGIPVFPMSLILIGLLILGLDLRFGDLALPLAIFLIFSYDILIEIGQNELFLLSNLDPALIFQIAMVIGGYFIAGKPSVRITKYFLPFFVIYLLLSQTRAYHLIEGSYYLTMIFSIVYPKRSSK